MPGFYLLKLAFPWFKVEIVEVLVDDHCTRECSLERVGLETPAWPHPSPLQTHHSQKDLQNPGSSSPKLKITSTDYLSFPLPPLPRLVILFLLPAAPTSGGWKVTKSAGPINLALLIWLDMALLGQQRNLLPGYKACHRVLCKVPLKCSHFKYGPDP